MLDWLVIGEHFSFPAPPAAIRSSTVTSGGIHVCS